MKKLFALFMVVAMLSVAGTAMATSLTASQGTVIVTQGNSATVTLTGTASHNGTLSAIAIIGAPSWATISGNTLTLRPTSSVSAGSYIITASVTESYTTAPADDTAGHGTPAAPVTQVETAVQPVTVTVLAATAGTQVISRIVETVVTTVVRVTTVATAVQKSTVVETFTQVIQTVVEKFTVTTLTQVSGITEEVAQKWTARAEAVQQAGAATATAVANNPAVRAQVFPRLSSTAVVTPRSNSSLKPATSSTASTATREQKLAAATSALGGAGKALSATDAVEAQESGSYSFPKTFGNDLWGTKIRGHNGRQARNIIAAFFAADVEDEGIAFLDSAGNVTNEIPGDGSDDIMPGYVNMMVVMAAGEVYEPVIFATDEALEENNVAVNTEETQVEVNEVALVEENVVVTVGENGNVESETVIEQADNAVETAMKSVMGSSLQMVPIANQGAVDGTSITADDSYANDEDVNLLIAARSVAFTSLENGAYYMPVTFNTLPTGRSLRSGAGFVFYPDGLLEGTTAAVTVFDANGSVVTSPSAMLGKDGYFAFTIENGGIVTANADNTLSNPTIAVQMTARDSGGNDDVYGVGSSSGGCSAGFAGLALAVLGSFVLTRKK